MLNATYVSSVDSELSTVQILRGIITEKLTTAAQEIFAVVERTVSGYEEEASGFRKELDRQRRQLEVVLQPQVTLCRIGLKSEDEEEPAQGAGLDQEFLWEPNEQIPPRTAEAAGSRNEGRQPDDSDEGLTESKTDSLPSNMERKLLARQLFLPSPESSAAGSEGIGDEKREDDRGGSWRPAESDEPQKNNKTKLKIKTKCSVKLRVCLLEDSEISVLSNSVFKKYPVQELQCPCGLQEVDFLDLLRSTFPQLAADKPFDVFTTDHSRKLQPLKAETLTPEEIYRTIRSAGNSALYIRPKVVPRSFAEGARSNEGRKQDDSYEGLTESKTDSLPLNTRRKWSARRPFLPSPESSAAGSEGIGDEKKLDDGDASWRPAESEKPQKNNKTKLKIKTKCSVKLRVCLLEDSEISVLSNSVFKKYRPQELQCPCGLQEVDFLDLLRSTFPQLAADKPFDVFTTDHSRKLQPLKAETLTPEEIYKTIRSAGNSALYIRPKVDPHLFAEEARSNDGRKQDDSDEGLTESKTDSLSSNTRRKRSARRLFLPSSAGSATDSEEEADEKRKDGGDGDWRSAEGDKPWEQNSSKLKIKTKCSVKLRVCLLEDSKISVLSNSVFKKYRPQELQCPCGLQEVDFLDLLRSTFPQLAPDKPFDVFTTDHSRKLQPLKAETLTPEEIYRTIRSAGNSALYIQPKAGEELQASGQRELVQRKDDATTDSPSASTSVMASDETSSPDPHKRENMVDVLSHSSMSQQEVMETEEADDDAGISEPSDDVQACSFAADSEGDNGDEEEAEKMNGRDDGDWKPDGADEELEESRVKSMVTRKRTQSSTKVLTEQSVVSCKVCGALYKSKNAVSKHAWSHADDPERLCGVCGERSESPEELRLHLQTHLKTHSCNTCGKSFIGINAFMEHRAGHTGHKPYKCNVCNKAFLLKSKLAAHQKFHLGGKHKCHVCQKSFGCEVELKLHSSVHTGVKLYSCSVCGKSLSGLRALSHHMLTHSGEKRYGCQVCGKRFRLLYHLRGHKKIHTVREKPYLCDICCKTFHTNSTLKAHMKIHNTACRERLHTCSKCGKGFMSQVGLLTHMKLHSEERPHSCPECGQSFKTKSNLKKHLILHSGDKQFVCSVCGKAWFHQEHLKVHMRTHNGERPFQCTVCDKAFTQSHCLKTHMKSHQGGQR